MWREMHSSLIRPRVRVGAGIVLLPSLRFPPRLLLLPSLLALPPLPLPLMIALRCLPRRDTSQPWPRLPGGFASDATKMKERRWTVPHGPRSAVERIADVIREVRARLE